MLPAPGSEHATTFWVILSLAAVACVAAVLSIWMWWRVLRKAVRLNSRLTAASTMIDSARGHSGTGFMIRAEFDLALDEAVARCDLSHQPLCVLFVDVDGFTAINDTLGHDVGDQVLREVARRLHAATPDKAAAARVSGDTFLLLIEGGLDEAKAMAQRVLTAVAEPLQAGSPRPIVLATSIGIAAYPLHGARQRLVPQAHTALRAVKQAGGRSWAVFDPQMAVDQRAQAALVADLRQAAAGQQFELFYQPKVDARTLQVTAAEALLRWHHPTQGVISPAIFIPLAERHGLIGELGNWVIEEACRQAGVWRQAGLRMRVAINLSAYQMRQDDMVPRIESALAKHRLQPGRFTVEITESLALENTVATQRTFEGLCRAGLHVAIDDFGAGQTSLAYLRQLPASELKMDMSLVQDLETSADARAIAQAVIQLAHALERRVVAEGVETPAQRDLLVRMGCDELQGYLFAKPMSATALGLWAMDDEFAHQPAFSASLFQDSQPAM